MKKVFIAENFVAIVSCHVAKFQVYVNQLLHGNNKIFLIFFSPNQFTKIIHLIALNEMQICLHFVKNVCVEIYFV